MVVSNSNKKSAVQAIVRESKKSRATRVIQEFTDVQTAVRQYMEDNSEVFDKFLDLADAYNAALGEAKEAIRGVSSGTKFAIGPISRAADSKEKVVYDADALPDSVLLTPGVIEKINAKKLDELIAAGVVAQSDVKDARREVAGNAPNVYGPKEITVIV